MRILKKIVVPVVLAARGLGQEIGQCVLGNVAETNLVQLTPELSLQWTVNDDIFKGAVTLGISLPSGWWVFVPQRLAFGFADKPGSMTNSDTVIGEKGGASVSLYTLTSKAINGINKMDGPVGDGRMMVADGKSILLFSLPLQGKMNVINVLGSNNLIYAYGTGDLRYHGPTRGSITVDFSSCPLVPDAQVATNNTSFNPVDVNSSMIGEENNDDSFDLFPEIPSASVQNENALPATPVASTEFIDDTEMNVQDADGITANVPAMIDLGDLDIPDIPTPNEEAASSSVFPEQISSQSSPLQTEISSMITKNDSESPFNIMQQVPLASAVENTLLVASPVSTSEFSDDLEFQVLDNDNSLMVVTTESGAIMSKEIETPIQSQLIATSAINSLTTQVVPEGCKSSDPDMQNELNISDSEILQWSIVTDGVFFRYILNLELKRGWMSVGFAKQAKSMVDAEAVIGFVHQGLVEEYLLTSKDINGAQRKNEQNNLLQTSVKTKNGSTILQFIRLINSSSTLVQTLPKGPSHLIFAHGPGALGFHSPQGRSYVTVDLTTCAVEIANDLDKNASQLVANTSVSIATATGRVQSSPLASVTEYKESKVEKGSDSMGLKGALPVECISSESDMDYEVIVDDMVTFKWRIDGMRLVVRAILNQALTTGWFAIGFAGRANHMTPADAVIGYTNGTLGELTITATDMSGVVSKVGIKNLHSGRITVQPSLNNTNNSQTILEFVYALGPATSKASIQSPMHLIYAFNNGPLAYHGRNNRGGLTLDLTSCMLERMDKYDYGKMKTHAILMFIAWGCLSPVGVLISRFMKPLTARTDKAGYWFTLHVLSQITAVGLAIGGLIVAVDMVNEFQKRAHQIVGCIVLGMAFCQPIISVIRPAPKDSNGIRSTARTIWEIIHKNNGRLLLIMGFTAIGLGLQEADAEKELKIVYYVWLGILVTVFGILTFVTKRHNAKKKTHKTMMQQPFFPSKDGSSDATNPSEINGISAMTTAVKRDEGGLDLDMGS